MQTCKGYTEVYNMELPLIYLDNSLMMNIEVFSLFFGYKMMMSYLSSLYTFFYSRKWYCRVKGHAIETLGTS